MQRPGCSRGIGAVNHAFDVIQQRLTLYKALHLQHGMETGFCVSVCVRVCACLCLCVRVSACLCQSVSSVQNRGLLDLRVKGAAEAKQLLEIAPGQHVRVHMCHRNNGGQTRASKQHSVLANIRASPKLMNHNTVLVHNLKSTRPQNTRKALMKNKQPGNQKKTPPQQQIRAAEGCRL